MKKLFLVGLLALFTAFSALAADEALVKESTGSQGDRLWLTAASGSPGDVVTVDLMIETAATEVDAVTISLKYDTSKLQYVDWADGSLNPGWVMFNINEKADGEISVGGFCVKTAIKPGSKGSIATLSFKVQSEASGEAAMITFDKIRDDVENFNFENGKVNIAAVVKQ